MGFTLYFLLFLLVALLTSLICLEINYHFSKTAQLINKIPGPKGYPFAGNAADLIGTQADLFVKFRKWSRQEKVYKLWPGHFYYVVCLYSPEDCQTVLSNIVHHEKSVLYSLLHDWLREGLLTSSFDKWQHRRKILTPTFHFNILKRFINIFNKHSTNLVGEIRQDHGQEIPILSYLSKSALHSITDAAMGSVITDAKSEKKYRDCVHRLGKIIVYRMLRPWLYLDIMNMFSLQYFQERFHLHYLKNFTKKVINEREKTFQEAEIKRAQGADDDNRDNSKRQQLAMLDLLLTAKNRGEIDYKGICEEVDTFMFEGHDTVSSALQFILMLIANHSDVQQKLYEEVMSILGKNLEPKYDDLNEMTYMEMVIKESLRLYPSVPLISRLCGEEFTTSSGHTVPVGTVLILHIYDTHRLEHVYPEPEKFIPERFSFENSKNRHPYAYIPFSAGARNCIGQKYAMLNMKCVLAAIIRSFVLLPVDKSEDIKLIADLIMRTKDPIRIKFKTRK